MYESIKPRTYGDSMTDLEQFKAMLDKAGYQQMDTEDDIDPIDLGHFEYIEVPKGSLIIIAFGPGRIGDSDTYVNMKFELDGRFKEHNCGYEGDE